MNNQIVISSIVAVLFMVSTAVSILGAAILFGTFESFALFICSVISFFVVLERVTYVIENR
jgi:hypothetical protein